MAQQPSTSPPSFTTAVLQVSERVVLAQKAYILFYIRRDVGDLPSLPSLPRVAAPAAAGTSPAAVGTSPAAVAKGFAQSTQNRPAPVKRKREGEDGPTPGKRKEESGLGPSDKHLRQQKENVTTDPAGRNMTKPRLRVRTCPSFLSCGGCQANLRALSRLDGGHWKAYLMGSVMAGILLASSQALGQCSVVP